MVSGDGPVQRLFTIAKRLLTSLLATGETRLRLAVLELEEERSRLVTLLMLVGLSLVMMLLGLGMLALLVVVLFWDTHRLAAIGVSALVLLGGGITLALLCLRLARRHTLLKETLSQLALDRHLVEEQRDTPRQ
ncbi:phage holin family protein [Billgrantia kenyensis]|uniref:Phage holin family protein n=1 Tax=Billgrantia kenyensis TaxID=321266 RepID=A0A7V9W382_9GAMM|nr:phage holin family protein [Halomonas kenyensis]MBA2780194.1 phage holin family protein [Halomonas kenyensis]MCG6663150.1 hypothetical protein [Halomonas kenyensis]